MWCCICKASYLRSPPVRAKVRAKRKARHQRLLRRHLARFTKTHFELLLLAEYLHIWVSTALQSALDITPQFS